MPSAYDAAWNLNRRTNNALVQTFGVNNLNELTNATRSGTLTVAGQASEPRGGDSAWGYPVGVTNVTVSGTGLTTGNAALYADGSWAKTNATLANGNNTYTATAKDTYDRTASDSLTVNLPATNTFSYDGKTKAHLGNAVKLKRAVNSIGLASVWWTGVV